jgi:hypothetical protein
MLSNEPALEANIKARASYSQNQLNSQHVTSWIVRMHTMKLMCFAALSNFFDSDSKFVDMFWTPAGGGETQYTNVAQSRTRRKRRACKTYNARTLQLFSALQDFLNIILHDELNV